MLALEIGRIQGKGKPVLSLKKMEESMGSWAIVQWTVPRLGIAYAWALPFLTMCRHVQPPVPSDFFSNQDNEQKRLRKNELLIFPQSPVHQASSS